MHTQAPTVFVNHVVPLQHTDTGRQKDFRRKVTPEIGVTTQNSQHLAHKTQTSPKLTLRQRRVEITQQLLKENQVFQISKEDGTTTHTELRGRHTYMLNAKHTTKSFEQIFRRRGRHTKSLCKITYTFRPPACTATLANDFTSTFSFGTVSHLSSTFYLAA